MKTPSQIKCLITGLCTFCLVALLGLSILTAPNTYTKEAERQTAVQ
jgi:hypothetical protein